MQDLDCILHKEEIDRITSSLGNQITRDYRNKDLVLVGVLKGAFVFLSDLARKIDLPLVIDFIQVGSYGNDTVSSGMVCLKKNLDMDVCNKDVLIVEDIVDTGITTGYLLEHVFSLNPRSVDICTLIDKQINRKRDIRIAYAGSVAEDGFLVGYGLDHAEQYRHLPEIYRLPKS